jgi:hypothetical protein
VSDREQELPPVTDSRRGPKSVLHEQTRQLLQSSRAHVQISQDRVASSIGRLLAAHQALTRGATSGQPGLDSVTFLLEILERPCDLDVLLFFHRHPRALLTPQYLVGRVGYDIHEIHASLKVLSAAGLLEWSKDRMALGVGGIRLYRLTVGTWDDLLPPFLWLASSPEGRHALRRALARKNDIGGAGLDDRADPG